MKIGTSKKPTQDKVNKPEAIADTERKKSILARIGGVIVIGLKVVAEEAKYFFNPLNWGHSGDRIKHEAKQAVNKARNERIEEYVPPIDTTNVSKDLNIRVTQEGKEEVVFKASEVFTGDISDLGSEKLGKIKELNGKSRYSNIAIDQQGKTIVITIDVEKIVKEVKKTIDTYGLEASEEQVRKLAIKRIIEEVDGSIKGLAAITGGEFKKYADAGLLAGIGESLYKDSQEKQQSSKQQASETVVPQNPSRIMRPSEAILPNKGEIKQQASETVVPCNNDITTQGNLTNPLGMYHLQGQKVDKSKEHHCSVKVPEDIQSGLKGVVLSNTNSANHIPSKVQQNGKEGGRRV